MPRRLEALEAHPFYQALSAPLVTRSSQNLDKNISVPPISPWRERSLCRRSISTDKSTSAAQRALGAVMGQTIPVNPARALSPGIARSVSVPKNIGPAKLVTISRGQMQHKASNLSEFGTIRTIDMIERFPLPPIRPKGECSQSQTDDGPVILSPSPLRPKRTSLNMLRLQQAGSEMANETNEENHRRLEEECYLKPWKIWNERKYDITPPKATAAVTHSNGPPADTPSNSTYHSATLLFSPFNPVAQRFPTTATCNDARSDGQYMSGALPGPPMCSGPHEQSHSYECLITDKPKPKLKLLPKTNLPRSQSGPLVAFQLRPHGEAAPRSRSHSILFNHSKATNGEPLRPISSSMLRQLSRDGVS